MAAPMTWSAILHTIRSGRDPKKADLAAALRSSRPPNDADLLRYFAAVLAGDIDRRGAPKHGWQRRTFETHYLVRRVERWEAVFRKRRHLRAPKQAAFEKVASEYGWAGGAKTAKRKFWAAKKKWLPIGNPDPWVTRVMRHNGFGPYRRRSPAPENYVETSREVGAVKIQRPGNKSPPQTAHLTWGAVGSLPTPVERG